MGHKDLTEIVSACLNKSEKLRTTTDYVPQTNPTNTTHNSSTSTLPPGSLQNEHYHDQLERCSGNNTDERVNMTSEQRSENASGLLDQTDEVADETSDESSDDERHRGTCVNKRYTSKRRDEIPDDEDEEKHVINNTQQRGKWVDTKIYTSTRRNEKRAPATLTGNGPHRKTSARDVVVYGKGASSLSMKTGPGRQNRPNRVCTGLFVTRLHRRITPAQLDKHVHLASGYTIKAEKLETKHDSYSSFFVRAFRSLRDALMDPDIWPTNSMVRLFFEC